MPKAERRQRTARPPPPDAGLPSRVVVSLLSPLLEGEAQRSPASQTLIDLPAGQNAARTAGQVALHRDLDRLSRLVVWCTGMVLVGLTALILVGIVVACAAMLIGLHSKPGLVIGLGSGSGVVTIGGAVVGRWTRRQLAKTSGTESAGAAS